MRSKLRSNMRSKASAMAMAAAVAAALGSSYGTALAAVVPNGISGVTATAFDHGDSTDPNVNGGVNQVVNGAGLTIGNAADRTTWAHDGAWQDGWQGNVGNESNGKGWFIADLGATHADLSQMLIWNTREVFDRGSKNVNIFYATTPTITSITDTRAYDFTSGGWTQLTPAAGMDLPQATGTAGSTQGSPAGPDATLSLAGVTARYVGFQINSNYGSTIRVGFSEIEFTTTPEPASLGLWCLGGVGLLARRRRRLPWRLPWPRT